MNEAQLKDLMSADLKTLKSLSVNIMPAKRYYLANLKGFAWVYFPMVFVGLLACFPPMHFDLWHDYFKHYHELEIQADIIFDMIMGCVLAPLVFALVFLSGKIKTYVIFKYQISGHLKTGELMLKKFRQASMIGLIFYTLFIFIMIPILEPDVTFFASIVAFLLSAFVLNMVINMEVSRIGIAPLSDEISRYFEKDKKDKSTMK